MACLAPNKIFIGSDWKVIAEHDTPKPNWQSSCNPVIICPYTSFLFSCQITSPVGRGECEVKDVNVEHCNVFHPAPRYITDRRQLKQMLFNYKKMIQLYMLLLSKLRKLS